jgi:protein involved in polysaccharide export with SLBB domain
MQVIAQAGGFGFFAAKQRVHIRRQMAGQGVIILYHFFSGRNVETNIDLLPGDVVIVPERGILSTKLFSRYFGDDASFVSGSVPTAK